MLYSNPCPQVLSWSLVASAYLHTLKAQWFMLFDPYAEIQTRYSVQTEEQQ